MPTAADRFLGLWKSLIPLALIWHTAAVVLFALLGVPEMVFVNLVCMTIWMICYFVKGRILYRNAVLIGSAVIIANSVLATIYMGWNSGFHYNLVFLAGFNFLTFWRAGVLSRAANLMTGLIIYIGLYFYSVSAGPLSAAGPVMINIINILNMMLTFIGFSVLSYFYYQSSSNSEKQIRETTQKLKILAGHDPLTKLMNRRNMESIIQEAITDYDQCGRPFAMIMSDIDDFKVINDTFGHEAGDFVLVEAADIIKNSLRDGDQVARWGGEEFLILLPDTELDSAKKAAERVKYKLTETPIIYQGTRIVITMTFGVGKYNGDIEACLRDADRALYVGKREGKNTVRLWGDFI